MDKLMYLRAWISNIKEGMEKDQKTTETEVREAGKKLAEINNGSGFSALVDEIKRGNDNMNDMEGNITLLGMVIAKIDNLLWGNNDFEK